MEFDTPSTRNFPVLWVQNSITIPLTDSNDRGANLLLKAAPSSSTDDTVLPGV